MAMRSELGEASALELLQQRIAALPRKVMLVQGPPRDQAPEPPKVSIFGGSVREAWALNNGPPTPEQRVRLVQVADAPKPRPMAHMRDRPEWTPMRKQPSGVVSVQAPDPKADPERTTLEQRLNAIEAKLGIEPQPTRGHVARFIERPMTVEAMAAQAARLKGMEPPQETDAERRDREHWELTRHLRHG